MNQLDIYENIRAIAQVADVEWINRKRKIVTETIITEFARGKINRLGLRQIASQTNSDISASSCLFLLVSVFHHHVSIFGS
jgi:hypothetical protein